MKNGLTKNKVVASARLIWLNDIKNNVFELRNGNTRIINNSGFGLRTGNFDSGNPPASANVPNVVSGGVAQNKFVNWLESKITNENAKILASPTLILGENSSSLFML